MSEPEHTGLEDRLRQAAQLALSAAGAELVDVDLVGQSGRTVIRLTIDKPEGVGIDDCASFSRHMGDILDVHDLVQAAYVLEVSSPGLDRPLKKDSDFSWAVGRQIKLTSRKPVEGKNVFNGELIAFDGRKLILETDRERLEILRDDIAKARLDMGDPFKRKKN